MTNPTDSQGLEGEDTASEFIHAVEVNYEMFVIGFDDSESYETNKAHLMEGFASELSKAREQAKQEVLDELEKELPLSERLAWSDEDGSYMDVRVFNNNINIWIQAHRQSKRTPTEKEKKLR